MNFAKRHGDMSMDMATSTMAMAMETASAAMDMAHAHETGSTESSSGMGMHMWFTAEFKDYPVIFRSLAASTKGEAFGIFILLFVIAFLARLLEFVRNYLEEVVWHNPQYSEFDNGVVNHSANLNPTQTQTQIGATRTSGDFSMDKTSGVNDEAHSQPTVTNTKTNVGTASRVVRDAIRLALCIIPDLFGYTLMLAAMTYTLTYFFAVVVGSGVGRFTSERLTERFRLKRKIPTRCVC
ncbi:uncharacterized protein LODBEIA_P42940 [Lodderomyces beijingensis]|uniref:Copper transport protein n=1 Tax=Lodderomyces beijingensis TaxID=1775926 RepID=A0ABP0ZS85_9ASCO